MNKFEILKKVLAISLTVMSFVPAVGAVKSENGVEGEPPTKIARIVGKDYNFNLMQAREFVCMSYFQKFAKDFIKKFPEKNDFIDAMKYMFEVFDGKKIPDSSSIERSLSIISDYMRTWKGYALMTEIRSRFDSYEIKLLLKDPEISFPRKIENLTNPSFIAKFAVDRPNLTLKIKNFEKIINARNEECELNFILKHVGKSMLVAVKNEDGKWISCLDYGIREISQEDIIREASFTNKEEILGYIKK